MNTLNFSKMQGAGNDFVVIDRDECEFDVSRLNISALCDRRFGIGADGLIILQSLQDDENMTGHVKMDFFNCDGSKAGMCGNGLRCAVCYAKRYGLSKFENIIFHTDSGLLTTSWLSEDSAKIEIQVTEEFRKYGDVNGYTVFKGDAGVPHAVIIVPSVEKTDVKSVGREIRYHKQFAPEGANVDFVQLSELEDGIVKIRTYERGVEDETLACGTGTVSTAHVLRTFFGRSLPIQISVKSGTILTVGYICDRDGKSKYFLSGPCHEVFSGRISIE